MERFQSMTMVEPIPGLFAFFLVSFWCAVVARDLIRTAGLIAAAGGMMFIAAHSSLWITERLIDLVEYLMILPVSWYHLSPKTYTFHEPLNWFPNLSNLPEGISMSVLFALMTIRNWNGGYGVVPYELFSETEKAIGALQPTNTFTVEDLARASALPARTQRWLRNSRMEVTISDPPAENSPTPGHKWKIYNLTLHLASGTTCKTSFPFAPDRPAMFRAHPAKCD